MIKNHFKEYFLLYVIITQPFLDIFAYFTLNTSLAVIPFMLRAVLLLITTLYTIKKYPNKKYLLFLLLLVLFSIFHLGNTYFTTRYSLTEDIKELVRIFYMPLMAINCYLYIKNNPSKIELLKKGIIYNMFIIFSVIILGLITNTSVPTYAEGIGLRGWFYNSNSQSLILCFIVPFSLYYCNKTKNILIKILLVFISFFLLFSNGTTGCYLMIFPTFILALYDSLISKDKKLLKVFNIFLLLIPLCASILFYKLSPEYKIDNLQNESLKETEENNSIDNIENETHENNKDNDKNSVEESEKELSKQQKMINYYFHEDLIKKYGYESIEEEIKDNFDTEHLVNNRFRKKITARVIYNNASLFTKLFGIEFTEIKMYESDLESDYSSILYYTGIVGTIIYIGLILYTLFVLFYQIIKNPKIIFNSEYLLLSGLFIMLNIGAEFSGSLLRRPNASIYLGLLIAFILAKYGKEKNEKKCNE